MFLQKISTIAESSVVVARKLFSDETRCQDNPEEDGKQATTDASQVRVVMETSVWNLSDIRKTQDVWNVWESKSKSII